MASQTQATQPEVANYITDIFGADSDDELDTAPVSRPPVTNFRDDNDEELQDSDDDVPAQKQNRLKSSSQSQARAEVDDHIEDSDEDDDLKTQKTKKTMKKKRKDSRSDSNSKEESSKNKKRKQSSSSSSSTAKRPTGDDKNSDDNASGDEYDSGEDVKRTADDDRFIDEDDDLAGVAGEYDAEEQVFDDERPDDYDKKGKPKPGRGGGGGAGGSGGGRKAFDPFSETLEAMKKPKAVLMSEAEKDKITERLLHRMHDAFVKDENCFKLGEPAIHKLQLLKVVQQMVAVKALQHNLLEKDILGAFKDWIEPKRDAAKTLPSLTVRTAIYVMLAKLPCQTDHLKRTDGDKKPIGYTILALRKHKGETLENKRALKDLMEKWCRPVFRKSADARSSTRDASATAELTFLANERTSALAAAAAAEKASKMEEEEEGEEERDRRSGRGSGFDAALAGAAATGGKDIYMRARTPYSSGFLFTVQPEAKVVERKESNEKIFGQTRAQLLKKMTNSGKKGGGGGTKENPRAMDMAMTGRNKA